MLEKLKRILYFSIMWLFVFAINASAHSGNITGWKDRESLDIKENNGRYYGYHREKDIIHYHEVEWDEENQKWIIVNPAVYYDENFNIIDNYEDLESEKIEVKFYSSIDGDTAKFEMNDEIVTVRFLGIDTPETVHKQKEEQPYGKEASNFTKDRLENAKTIEIEYDSKSLEIDKYNRILAWIWVDNILLQEELVSNGLAKTYMLQNNYKYAGQLQLAESEAKSEKIGIWSDELEENDKEENSKDEYSGGLISAIILIIFEFIVLIADNVLKKRMYQKIYENWFRYITNYSY